jgi:hypothetical protein
MSAIMSSSAEPLKPRIDENPYVAPFADLAPVPEGADLEAIGDQIVLQLYRGRERLIKVLAHAGDFLARLLCFLGSMGVLTTLAIYALGPKSGKGESELAESLLVVVLLVLIPGAVLFFLSRALKRFRRWARIVTICLLIPLVLSSGFLVLVTMGSLAPGLFVGLVVVAVAGLLLYVFASQEASVVFSDSYRQAVARSEALFDFSDNTQTRKLDGEFSKVRRWLLVALIAIIAASVVVAGLAIVASMQ